ncbi:type II secretion system protein GspL [Beggiatoa leptomitoformis]|nr:type II secretion system protein GspL [Beggiatoa leptomitoformis]
MRYFLLCRLGTDVDALISWVLYDHAGKRIDSANAVSLATLPPPASHVLSVLVPSTACLLTTAHVPTTQRQRLLQAVPYALEELFAEDVEALHFALGERLVSEQVAVAVTTHQKMQQWLALFTERGYKPQTIMPDVLAVPRPENTWGILFYNQVVLVRTGDYSGFGIELETLQTALQLALHQQAAPARLVVYYARVAPPSLTVLRGLGIPIEEQAHTEDSLGWLLQGITQKNKTINLLQGEYRPQDKIQTLWKPWRLTIGLLLVWGVILFIQQIVEYQDLSQQRTALNTEIEALYRQTFPDAKRIVNARVQMEQQLNTLKNQQSNPLKGESYLTTLAQLSPILKQAAGLHLKRLDYRQGRFDLELELANLQALEQIKQSLSQMGFTVELQSASSRDNVVEARLRLQKNPI